MGRHFSDKTLVIASHDRYFIERVADSVYAIDPDRGLRHLPGGVEQYLDALAAGGVKAPSEPDSRTRSTEAKPGDTPSPGAMARTTRREIRRIEGALAKLQEREAGLHAEMDARASDHERLSELQGELDALHAERDALETAWLTASDILEQ